MQFRQGDIYIEGVRFVPEGAVRTHDTVLVEGEATGHRHRVRDFRSAVVYELGNELFVDVVGDRAEVVHDEHGPIELLHGVYRVWRQREYDPRPDVRQRIVFD
jgi:hypothetical protein